MLRIGLILLVTFVGFLLSDNKGGNASSSTYDESDYNDSAYTNEDEEIDDPFAGWEHLEEPIGDESFIEYRVTPASFTAGDEVEFEVAVGSFYGPVDGITISSRCTSGSKEGKYGLIDQHTKGAPWQTLDVEGMYKINDESGEMIRLPGLKPPQEEIYGYMLHTLKFKIPQDNEIIEMRIERPAMNLGSFHIPRLDFAFQANPRTE